ncbi:MAG: alpha/beta hydrolase [Oscillospiraceae bacterium]|nr:alpha/beta hydrolase [Oscillospiraceae bacterium]
MLWILLKLLLALAGAFVVLLLAAGYFGFVYSLRRPRPGKKPGAPETDPDKLARNAAREKAKLRFFALEPEDVQLRSQDGTLLRGWFFPAPTPSRNLVIFAHGYHSDGSGEFADQLDFYRSELGFHCLYPDHRAHGRSEGKTIGFGAPESRDLLDWARQYIALLGDDIEIVLHGISMGGATVTLCAAQDPPPQVKCIVADCGYTNAYEQIRHTMATEMHLRFPPLLWALAFWCRLLAGYSLRHDADPLGKLPNATRPILFIHGQADDFVPFAMGKRLFAACPTEKDALWVPGAAHAIAHHTDTAGYEALVKSWHLRHLPPAAGLVACGAVADGVM